MSHDPAISAGRPPAFSYLKVRKGLLRRSPGAVLCCEEIPLTTLAARYGTPLYVYSATTIREALATTRRDLSGMSCTQVARGLQRCKQQK